MKIIPNLIFTAYKNSYKVEITNLEKLDVTQIQEFQNFVEYRYGIFDFENYSFSIQKRLDFEQFKRVLNSLNIKAIVSQKFLKEKKEPKISFGQYKGMGYKELPDSYMLWLKTNYRGYDRDKIDSELKARNL